jgi:hypothetical protein
MVQVDDDAIEVVDPEGAALAALVPARVEHEVVDDELVAALEEVGQRLLAPGPVEDVVLLHLLPRQLPALLAELVAQAREFLLAGQVLAARLDPFLA